MISLRKLKIVIKKIKQRIKKKVTKIDDIDVNKILVSKEEPYGTKIYSKTLPDTMAKIFLDHYG